MNKVSIFKHRQALQAQKGKPMSEAKEPRPFKEINQEYIDTCVKYGDLHFKMQNSLLEQKHLEKKKAELDLELAARTALDLEAKTKEEAAKKALEVKPDVVA
jgi:hypothetical protein